MSKLKLGGNEIYTGLYQDIFWWFDNHPEYAGKEEEGFKQLWKHLKSNANIPDRSLLDDDARRLIIDMVNKALTARDWEAEVNKRLNNRIRDEDVQVESFVNGEMWICIDCQWIWGMRHCPEALIMDIFVIHMP
jgi:hypothetical protein